MGLLEADCSMESLREGEREALSAKDTALPHQPGFANPSTQAGLEKTREAGPAPGFNSLGVAPENLHTSPAPRSEPSTLE